MHIPSKNACRDFDKTNCRYFLIKDEKLLEKYNGIWKKKSAVASKKKKKKKKLIVNRYKIKRVSKN